MRTISRKRRCAWLAALLALAGAVPTAFAVPSFARQTGMACEACHTVFPELTHFGRVFKANGYVLDNIKQVRDVSSQKDQLLELAQTPPLSIMVQASYTQLSKSLPDLSAAGIKDLAQNGTVSFPQQIGIFYAGKIAPHFGAFLQITYSSASGSIGADNTDLRLADTRVLPSNQSLTYGLSINNNPTVQDLWNTTPGFGFPYVASSAGVSSLAHAQIDGQLAQSVAGPSVYVFWDESLYAELGVYRSAKQGSSNSLTGASGPLDGTASNVLKGLAPYWRVAYEYDFSRHSIEAGAYGLQLHMLPGGALGADVPLSGPYNEFKDVAEDIQYQFIGEDHFASVLATHIHENQTLNATFAAGGSNLKDDLNTSRIAATYYYKRRLGGTCGWFSTTGSSDPGLYASPVLTPGSPPPLGVVTSANSKPDTAGWVAEVNYLPWLNTKFAVQYTAFSKFNGGSTNYDGVGRNASANNTLYVNVWFAY